MRNEIMKYAKRNLTIKIMYIDDCENVTERMVKVIKLNSSTFTAYCHLRGFKRTFKFNNVLAVAPVRERAVV